MWLRDTTEHPTGEGKLCLCVDEDAYTGRIKGYWWLCRRRPVWRCTHGGRGGQSWRDGRVRSSLRPLNSVPVELTRGSAPCQAWSVGRVGVAGDNAAMQFFFALLQNYVLERRSWRAPESTQDYDNHLARAGLPRPPADPPDPLPSLRMRLS